MEKLGFLIYHFQCMGQVHLSLLNRHFLLWNSVNFLFLVIQLLLKNMRMLSGASRLFFNTLLSRVGPTVVCPGRNNCARAMKYVEQPKFPQHHSNV